jgi:hypothetical protein
LGPGPPAGIAQAFFPGAAGKIEKRELEERARRIAAAVGEKSMHPTHGIAAVVVERAACLLPEPAQPAATRTQQTSAAAVAIARSI